MDCSIFRKITVNQVQKCGLRMPVGYISSLIEDENETCNAFKIYKFTCVEMKLQCLYTRGRFVGHFGQFEW